MLPPSPKHVAPVPRTAVRNGALPFDGEEAGIIRLLCFQNADIHIRVHSDGEDPRVSASEDWKI